MATDAQRRANTKYHEKLDRISIRVPKGYKEEIQNFASSRGESMNSFILHAINDAMSTSSDSKHS